MPKKYFQLVFKIEFLITENFQLQNIDVKEYNIFLKISLKEEQHNKYYSINHFGFSHKERISKHLCYQHGTSYFITFEKNDIAISKLNMKRVFRINTSHVHQDYKYEIISRITEIRTHELILHTANP